VIYNCRLPFEVRPIPIEAQIDTAVRDDVPWLIGNRVELLPEIELIANAQEGGADPLAQAVRLVSLFQPTREQLQVLGIRSLEAVLRADWIVDERGFTLDGNNLWPGAGHPERRSSGNGSQGGDWRSLLHVRNFLPDFVDRG